MNTENESDIIKFFSNGSVIGTYHGSPWYGNKSFNQSNMGNYKVLSDWELLVFNRLEDIMSLPFSFSYGFSNENQNVYLSANPTHLSGLTPDLYYYTRIV